MRHIGRWDLAVEFSRQSWSIYAFLLCDHLLNLNRSKCILVGCVRWAHGPYHGVKLVTIWNGSWPRSFLGLLLTDTASPAARLLLVLRIGVGCGRALLQLPHLVLPLGRYDVALDRYCGAPRRARASLPERTRKSDGKRSSSLD